MVTGSFCLLLHAHLPFVRHPEHEEFLEESWLFEAISETYLPLLRVLEGWERDGLPGRLTMSVTPTLCEMLADALLMTRYQRHLERLLELAHKETFRLKDSPPFSESARMYLEHFTACREAFLRWDGELVGAFRHYQEAGLLEIVTCAATHGFLPLMITEEAIRAQVQIARQNYLKHFGIPPRGIWLPECAYRPGIDKHLEQAGLGYFFVDFHGLYLATPRPKYGVYRPVYCPSGVAAFGRDPESSKQVWSREEGYPGDFEYREFYRDLGYDGDYEYVRPYLHRDGVRRNLGFKYHRITGSEVDLAYKEPYRPALARERAAVHAGNFLFNRQHQARYLRHFLGAEPIVVAPYDAELFGHWWFEGPQFLDYLVRKMVCDQDEVRLITPSRYLEENSRHQVVTPSASSWGDRGYFEVWLNGTNDWIYRHLHASELRMRDLARRYPAATGLLRRALNQAARELLLAQASDWAFIMTTRTMVAYAERRTREHLSRFHGLYLQLTEDRLEEEWLAELEKRDNLFAEIDYRVYA